MKSQVEKEKFGRYWRDSFHWDLVSKQVVEVKMRIEDRYANSRKKFRIWQDALKSDIGHILRASIGKDMEDFIRWAQRVEWDNIIVENLEASRKQDQYYDTKMAWLVYYNDEIDGEEMGRRWDTLDRNMADRVIDYGNMLMDYPWPQSWHDGEIQYTQEEWDSAVENFPKALAAIQRIPAICLERRRLEAPTFWRQQKEAWRSGFEKEFSKSRAKKEELGGHLQQTNRAIKGIQKAIKRTEDERSQRKEELTMKIKASYQVTDNAIRHLPGRRAAPLSTESPRGDTRTK
jgi:hypothetical protein